MSYCDYDKGDEGYRCRCCGRTLPQPLVAACPKNCAEERPDQGDVRPEPPREKLGDWTERQLKKIGVTQDRYKAAKELFGLSPSCNCSERREWINRVGEWWTGQ